MFVTANTFFNSKAILERRKRPYKTVEEMNEDLINKWNAVVCPSDHVFHLGNFGFGSVESLARIRNRLNGSICLIRGPHDPNTGAVKRMGLSVRYGPHVIYDATAFGGKTYDVEMSHRPSKDTGSIFWNQTDPPVLFLSGGDGTWRSRLHGHHGQLNVDLDCHELAPVSLRTLAAESTGNRRETTTVVPVTISSGMIIDGVSVTPGHRIVFHNDMVIHEF
jgi:calcineurin-like phosphoesterase family protein